MALRDYPETIRQILIVDCDVHQVYIPAIPLPCTWCPIIPQTANRVVVFHLVTGNRKNVNLYDAYSVCVSTTKNIERRHTRIRRVEQDQKEAWNSRGMPTYSCIYAYIYPKQRTKKRMPRSHKPNATTPGEWKRRALQVEARSFYLQHPLQGQLFLGERGGYFVPTLTSHLFCIFTSLYSHNTIGNDSVSQTVTHQIQLRGVSWLFFAGMWLHLN